MNLAELTLPMSDLERSQRAAVVAEAETWIGTPYAHMQMVKGAGVDCATILKAVYGTVFPEVRDAPLEYYPPDWHLHRDDERYVNFIRQYATETDAPLPGDIVVVKFGRSFAHGGLVVAWPEIIHSYLNARCVVREDFLANKELSGRPRRYFTPWKKESN